MSNPAEDRKRAMEAENAKRLGLKSAKGEAKAEKKAEKKQPEGE